MATRVKNNLKKEHSCQVWSKLAKPLSRRRCLKELLTTDTGPLEKLPLSMLCSGELKMECRGFTHVDAVRGLLSCSSRCPGFWITITLLAHGVVHCGILSSGVDVTD